MIEYSIEKLYHFICKKCEKWWTIGDFALTPGNKITCPHCGNTIDQANVIPAKPIGK